MKRILASDPDFERRARLSVVWQDLVTPVRAIAEYQEIISEEGRRLGLTELMPYLDRFWPRPARSATSSIGSATRATTSQDGRPDEVAGRKQAPARSPDAAERDHRLQRDGRGGSGRTCRSPVAAERRREAFGRVAAAARTDRRYRRSVAPARPEVRGRRIGCSADVGEAAWSALFHTLRPVPRPERGEVARILVVDDNETNRDLLSRRLRHDGHHVAAAASGREALDLLEGASVRPSPARPPDARHERHRGA